MKILQIHRWFYTEGGAERYFFEVSKLLIDNGNEVTYFSAHDKKEFRSPYNKYFVSNISTDDKSLSSKLKKAERIIYSLESRKKIRKLLEEIKPDIAHIHLLSHHISPSILHELKDRNIPIVQTVPNYHLISPSWNLFHDNKICEITKGGKYFKGIFHKCGSSSSNIFNYIIIFAQYVHKLLKLYDYVDYFICPSKFLAAKLIEYGFPKEKIIYLPYFLNFRDYIPNYAQGNYILFFGRLAPEKGLNQLIDAMKLLPNIKLKIVGRGIQKYELLLKQRSQGLQNIEFLTFQDGCKLKKTISESRFTILPSIWYEVFGISILESFASGKPVIASEIGGIPEIVKDGYNGLLFKPGEVKDLAEKINKLWNNPLLCRKLGNNGREYVVNNFAPEKHYKRLMEIYKNAIINYGQK